MGSARYAPENDALVWKIKSFPGNKVGFGSIYRLSACHMYLATEIYLVASLHYLNHVCQLKCLGVYVEGRI